MRYAVSPSDLKTFAHRLGVLSPSLTLASRLEVLSRTFGYRDWHEASTAAGEGYPVPLDTNKRGFIGVPDIDRTSPEAQLLIQFHAALIAVAGSAGYINPHNWDCAWHLGSMLWALGLTEDGVRMPEAVHWPTPIPREAGAFYKRLARASLRESRESGTWAFGGRYSARVVDPNEFDITTLVRDARELGDAEAQRLTGAVVSRLADRLGRYAGPVDRAEGEVACRTETALAIAETDGGPIPLGGRQYVAGACLVDSTVSASKFGTEATLQIELQSCLVQHEDMGYAFGEAMVLLVSTQVEALLAATIGCSHEFSISVVVSAPGLEATPRSVREQAAAKQIADIIVDMTNAKFEWVEGGTVKCHLRM